MGLGALTKGPVALIVPAAVSLLYCASRGEWLRWARLRDASGIDPMVEVMALADALLISLSDSPDLGLTVPGKLASYMAAAKPVLASMNGAGYAAVLESGGGLVSPACDQKALADNMLALYRMTDAERAALGAKAKAYYTAHYRRAELLKRLEEFTVKGV